MFEFIQKLKEENAFKKQIENNLDRYIKECRVADKAHEEETRKRLMDYIDEVDAMCAAKGKKYSEWLTYTISIKIRR